jgi:Protein of unknown function (DUF295)
MELHGPFRKNSLYLLLPYDNEKEIATLCQISNSEAHTFYLPELRNKWIHGSSHGWLVTTDIDLHVTLVNPLTRAQIQLLEDTETYPQFTVSGQHIPLSIKEHMAKLVLSENASLSTGCVVATVMTTFTRLFVRRIGDDSWTCFILKPRRIDYDHNQGIDDVIFFQGKLYATLRDVSYILIVDYDEQNFQSRHVSGPKVDYPVFNILSGHLVECSGDLLMVLKRGRLPTEDGPPTMVRFELYRFEKETETCSEIHGIGDKRLFLGPNASVSISASEVPGCKTNCIYFLDHFHERPEEAEYGYKIDNGVFSLDENKLNLIRFPNSEVRWTWPAMWYRQNI